MGLSLRWLTGCRACCENYMSYHIGRSVVEGTLGIEHLMFARIALLEVEGLYYSSADLVSIRLPYVIMAAFDLYSDVLLSYLLVLICKSMAEAWLTCVA